MPNSSLQLKREWEQRAKSQFVNHSANWLKFLKYAHWGRHRIEVKESNKMANFMGIGEYETVKLYYFV